MHASLLLKLIKKNKIEISLEMRCRLAGMIIATDNIYHHDKIEELHKL
jgi:hypothetical protein